MKNGSYANEVKAAKVMLAGLQANQERLKKWGIDEDFLAEMAADYESVLTLNNEQQALIARLKEKTAVLNEKMMALYKKRGTAKKLVKIAMVRQSWNEFGISDSR